MHEFANSRPERPHAAVRGAESAARRRSTMAKKSRGGRMTAAKQRAAKSTGGKGRVSSRPAGKRIMST